MVDLANSYRQAGDSASAQNVLQMAVNLGQQLDADGPGGRFVINNLVGLAIQLNALGAMDPASPYGELGPDGSGLRGPTHATESGHQTALHPGPRPLAPRRAKPMARHAAVRHCQLFRPPEALW